MTVANELIDSLPADDKKPEDLIGENGLLKLLTKKLVECSLEAEMAHHLGQAKNENVANPAGNTRNGTGKRTLKGDFGELPLEIPRDRHASFEPQIVTSTRPVGQQSDSFAVQHENSPPPPLGTTMRSLHQVIDLRPEAIFDCMEKDTLLLPDKRTSPATYREQGCRSHCLNCATSSNCIVGALTPADRAVVSRLIRERAFCRGAEISSEGDMASSMKIIKVGTVFSYRAGNCGRRQPIAIAGRGHVFGMYGFFGQPNQISAVAVSAGRICELSILDVKENTSTGHAFREKLILRCIRAFGLTADWSAVMRQRTMIKQLAYTLFLLSDVQGSPVVQLPTHTALAELLGTTRESIVRGLILLEGERCISKLERKKCHVYGDRLLEWLGSALLVQAPRDE